MRIILEVKTRQPFAGFLQSQDSDQVEFAGWLDFLRRLSEMLELAVPTLEPQIGFDEDDLPR